MTLGPRIAWDDTVLPFQLDRSDIRGRVARLDCVLEKVLAQHSYPEAIESLVSEMALLTALIGQAVKLRWKLSLQLRGNGPVRLVATDYFAPAAANGVAGLRAYAGFDRDHPLTGRPFDLLGRGYFAILIHQGQDMQPYQGITPLDGDSVARCAETYFAQSEQLPTRFALAHHRDTGRWRAGGVMLQHMPEASPHAGSEGGSGEGGLLRQADLTGEGAEDWTRTNLLLDTVTAPELTGPEVQPTDLLVRLFHEEGPRVFDPQPVSFWCSCSEDKVRQSLSIYSARDIRTMTTPEGTVTADCQFCGAHYVFDPATVGFEAGQGDG